MGNLARGLQTSQLDVGHALLDGLANQLRGLCLSLGPHDGANLLLLCPVHNEGGALGLLLGNLLGLHGGCEFRREGNDSQRDIVQLDVEARGAAGECVPHQPAHLLTLRNQLRGIELRHDGLEDFIHDRWEHALVKVLAQGAVDERQGADLGAGEDPHRDVDHLQVLCSRQRGDIARLCPHVVENGRLEPGDVEVCALVVDVGLDAAQAGVLDGAHAPVHVEEGIVGHEVDGAQAHDHAEAREEPARWNGSSSSCSAGCLRALLKRGGKALPRLSRVLAHRRSMEDTTIRGVQDLSTNHGHNKT